ncbi:hypothetical protein E4U61_004179 [Claviceps capensis]|nr:hypothetical protein E4U61_004179 [Claviceps capensis]
MMGFLELGASVSARYISESAIPESAIPEPTIDLSIPSWDVAIEPGQKDTIVVNGTIQQVDSYMEAHYPGARMVRQIGQLHCVAQGSSQASPLDSLARAVQHQFRYLQPASPSSLDARYSRRHRPPPNH